VKAGLFQNFDPRDSQVDAKIIAVLFCQSRTRYRSIPNLEIWTERQDARTYAGPHPVIAHPPCSNWGRYARSRKGQDGGCFAAALSAINTWGGLLEHPQASAAWTYYRLPEPNHAGGWSRNLWHPGASCKIDQGHYGHRAPKPTWIYAVLPDYPALIWGDSTNTGRIEIMGRSERERTPIEFATLLVNLLR
jgi:hypothetical protein